MILQQAVGRTFAAAGHSNGRCSSRPRPVRSASWPARCGWFRTPSGCALLEEHASAHGTKPQDVLDALAEHTTDLELQGWALAGYDPPWTVRVMRCSCVDGMRNFRLQAAEDGTHYWACASCHASDRHPS